MKVQITISLDIADVDRVDALKLGMGCSSRSHAVRDLLRYALHVAEVSTDKFRSRDCTQQTTLDELIFDQRNPHVRRVVSSKGFGRS